MHVGLASPETTVALALLAGILAQSIARHLRVPGIVLLLLAGVVLGPDVAQIVQPDTLGGGLLMLVGFAVAVILFEGGMNLDLKRLRRESRAIRRLVTVGALLTLLGGALVARLILDMPWLTAVLFGTLVIVTGPTVITPLLRRFRVESQTATVLEAEGVLIDAVGAVIAIVALEFALNPSGQGLALGVVSVPLTLGAGAALGALGGFVMATLLGIRALVPEGLVNVLTLSMVLSLFQVSNALIPESGISAVTVAGIVVGNRPIHLERDLRDFKEQLTVLFIGLLFVLLAADVRMDDVRALGWPGLLAVTLLMLVVRPLNVMVATRGTELSIRQRFFISAIGPRGIVAAAVAAFFAAELERTGMPGGEQLRAMVFLVIVVTVVVAGLSGGLLAKLLGLQRPSDVGYVILGANALARAMAHALGRNGQETVCIDTNPDACDAAQREGLRVLFGSGMHESVLARAEIDTRRGAIALSPSTEVNLLFAQRVAEEASPNRLLVAARRVREDTTYRFLERLHAELLFGGVAPLELWSVRVDRGIAQSSRYRLEHPQQVDSVASLLREAPDGSLLPLTIGRDRRIDPVGDRSVLSDKDILELLVNTERAEAAGAFLRKRGFVPVAPEGDSDGG